MIREHQIEVDGEARHVPEKQIDRRAALQCKDSAFEDYRCDLCE